MERVVRLIIFVLLVFIILKASTFGWCFWRKAAFYPEKSDSQLAQRLKQHVDTLSQQIGERSVFRYEALNEAAQYITEEFISFGYKVKFQEYKVYDKVVKNIIVEKTGTQNAKETIIVGAHYDTCFNPGADDNASGIAGLLESARFFADKNTDKTIKFIAFVNEEPPFFQTQDMGSRVYTKDAKASNENIIVALILESVGYYSDKLLSQRYPMPLGFFYPNKGNFIAVVGNLGSGGTARKVASLLRKQRRIPVELAILPSFFPAIDFSDHWSFWKEGYPALMITDTAFLRNANYHRQSDTYEKLNYDYMAELLAGFVGVLSELSDKTSH